MPKLCHIRLHETKHIGHCNGWWKFGKQMDMLLNSTSFQEYAPIVSKDAADVSVQFILPSRVESWIAILGVYRLNIFKIVS